MPCYSRNSFAFSPTYFAFPLRHDSAVTSFENSYSPSIYFRGRQISLLQRDSRRCFRSQLYLSSLHSTAEEGRVSPPIYRSCRSSLPLVFDGPPPPHRLRPILSSRPLGEFGLGLLGRFIPRGTSPALFPSLSFHYSVDCCVRYRLAPWRRRGGDDGGYRIVTWGGRSYLARWRPALSSSLPLLSFILLLSSSPPFPPCRINHPERRPPHTRRRRRPERVTSSDGSCMFVVVLSVAHRRTPTHQRQYPCRCRRIVHYVTLPCFYCGRTSAMAEVRRAAADDGRQRSGPQGGGAAAALWCNKIICFCCILWCRW